MANDIFLVEKCNITVLGNTKVKEKDCLDCINL